MFSGQNFKTSGNYPEISDISVVDVQWSPAAWYLRLTICLSYKTVAHISAQKISGRNMPGLGSINIKSGYSTHKQSKVFFEPKPPIVSGIR